MKSIPNRTYLTQDQLPAAYYNLAADMPQKPDPLLNPATMKPVTADELYPIFCRTLVGQELDTATRFIEIPPEVRQYYNVYRPSPLVRAYNLEKELKTPARIYYKFEGNNTSGSHKLNSAAAQAYYAKAEGLRGLTTETGAGQWGTALAEACAYFGMPLKVFMVKSSLEQKPFRRIAVETFGGSIVPSPSDTTASGRKILGLFPGTGGSLGCAISEAVETARLTPGYKYVLGSVLNYVLLHQSIIGLEAYTAMEMLDEYPDIIIGCAGGGSNLGGLISPFMRDKLQGRANPQVIAVEPSSCPSLTRGKYAYDFCDTAQTTPLAKMYTMGSGFIPHPGHAGGLRYHGMSPIVSKLYHDGYIAATSASQTDVFSAALTFSRCETILPAPESSHAIFEAIRQAELCRESGQSKTILFGLTGTGYYDMAAYDAFNKKEMIDPEITDDMLARGFSSLPDINYTVQAV